MSEVALERLARVAHALAKVTDQFVFVGGAIVPLLITDDAAPRPSPTKDIDAIVPMTSSSSYLALSKRLYRVGFRHDPRDEDAVFVTFEYDGLRVDVMPTDCPELGAANRWFTEAFESAVAIVLSNGQSIRVANAPSFIATKIEAFESRGQGDLEASKDVEDIFAVVGGRRELTDESPRCRRPCDDGLARGSRRSSPDATSAPSSRVTSRGRTSPSSMRDSWRLSGARMRRTRVWATANGSCVTPHLASPPSCFTRLLLHPHLASRCDD